MNTTRILVQSDSKSEDKSDFLVRLQRPLMNVRKISLIGMTIPNTCYTVTSHDDQFSVELENAKNIECLRRCRSVYDSRTSR